jgi:hypothetical protein
VAVQFLGVFANDTPRKVRKPRQIKVCTFFLLGMPVKTFGIDSLAFSPDGATPLTTPTGLPWNKTPFPSTLRRTITLTA